MATEAVHVVLTSFLVMSLFFHGIQSAPLVPCYFIFGDSLVDNGNNNRIASIARADYAPYGIDFPRGPTGRFCNGRTTTDVIAELLGFDDYIPPYSGASADQILSGVNFASAAAGIRDETGQQLGGRISMNGQVRNYQSAVERVVDLLGDEDSAANYLSKCLFTVGMGSNDYLNNYFMPTFYSTGRQYTPEQYADVLIQQYSGQLRTMYNYGARKVALIGVGQVGCSPSELAQNNVRNGGCVERIDSAIQIFNNKLRSLVVNFNSNLPGAKFTYINGYAIFEDIVRKAPQYGFTNLNTGCCGVGRNNGQITCLPLQTPCRNRDSYIFWDAFHPTEKVNVIFARRAFSAQSPNDASPVDISRLARS